MVHKIFVADTKLNISAYYLRPGGPFGGSCLPKDVRALQHISSDIGASTHVVDALMRSNEAHKHFLFTWAVKGLEPGARVLMLGLAFKSDTDDLRESPNVDLARKLIQGGYAVSIYDPSLKPEHLIGQNLGYAFSYLPRLIDCWSVGTSRKASVSISSSTPTDHHARCRSSPEISSIFTHCDFP